MFIYWMYEVQNQSAIYDQYHLSAKPMFGRTPQLRHFTTSKIFFLGHQKSVLEHQPGLFHNCLSADAAVCDDPIDLHQYPLEFLHSPTPSVIPPHQLWLKDQCDAMLHRILNAE